MEQRGTYPGFKAINEHEGLAKTDIDGDGKLDIVGGGRWFKHNSGHNYTPNIIDASYAFSRSAAGQLVKGGRPEVILVVGDGWAPLIMYEWKKGTWISKILIEEFDCGHSLDLIDFNGDGNLDIWVAEMRLNGANPDAKNLILLGDGKGNFEITQVSSGIANHESKIADLDGDGSITGEQLGALTAAIYKVGSKGVKALKRGPLEELYLRGAHGTIHLYVVGQKAILSVLARPEANMGMVHIESREQCKRVEQILNM